MGESSWCRKLIQELYDRIVPVIVDTELRRGEAETPFSSYIVGIAYISGCEYLIRILMAKTRWGAERITLGIILPPTRNKKY